VFSNGQVSKDFPTKILKKMEQKIIWDKWQQEVLDHAGNITLRTGRQVGKSLVISEKAAQFALKNPNTSTLIIAASQRQSGLLFEKIRNRIQEEGWGLFKEPPTLTKIILTNGSKIYCLPAGRTAYSIRGYTVDMLIADEAAYIPEAVWNAVIPMIAVSRQMKKFGFIVLLSTPFGKGGYFFNSFTDLDFRQWHVSSEECKRIPLDFLKKEKERMTKAEYRQEYLGEFTDEWNQFFSTELIKKRMTFIEWNKKEDYNPLAGYYLGVDIARYGGDENAFVICEMFKTKLKIVKCFTTSRISTTDTIGRIIEIDKEFHFKKIFLDDSGVGGSVTDSLIDKLGRRVLGLNNASKRFEMQGEEHKKGILKEDLYSNVLMLMETERIDLISDLDLLRSLKCITYQYGSEETKGARNIHIFGNYSHLTEAMIRACWCTKEKGLNLYVY
jgi:hypothetical protein